MGMHLQSITRHDTSGPRELAAPATRRSRRVSADLAIGLGVLGVAILGKLLWVVTDGGILAVFGAR